MHFENKIELAVIKNSFSGSLIAGKTHQSVFYSYSYSTITLLFAMHDDFYAHVFIFSKNYVLFITAVLNHITVRNDNIEELHNFKAIVEAGA